jgi:hypothetical protein
VGKSQDGSVESVLTTNNATNFEEISYLFSPKLRYSFSEKSAFEYKIAFEKQMRQSHCIYIIFIAFIT